jgi:hypothetical protein
LPGLRIIGCVAVGCLMSIRMGGSTFFKFVLAFAAALSPAYSQASTQKDISVEQILERMKQHDQRQKADLKRYHAVRHYEAQYHGYGTTLDAKMEVEVDYDASTGKHLHVVSESGSKLLDQRVLQKAVDSEEEAARDPAATALTEANYKFELEGSERLNGRPAYILKVKPLRKSKFLYEGRVWVDAADFALVKLVATPAKNPSFWISRTVIRFSNEKIGEFWLPRRSENETDVRIGGTARLTIDYGDYDITKSEANPDAGSTRSAK